MESWKNGFTTAICALLAVFVPLIFAIKILELPNLEQRLIAGIFLVPLCAVYFRWISSNKHDLWLPINLVVGTVTAAFAYSWAQDNPQTVSQISEYIQQNQQTAVLCLVALGITNMLLTLVVSLSNRLTHTAVTLTGKVATKGESANVTTMDKRTIAVHEAGHAVLLGLHKELPESSELVMRKTATDAGSLGHCTGVSWDHQISNKIFVEWNMLFCLAGVEAERLVLGEVSLGGSSDYRNWQSLADLYLSGHDSMVYFHEIKAPWHEEYNAKVIYDLKESQKQIVREMLLENEEVLIMLRDALIERGGISGKEFLDVLSQVVPTASTPRSSLFKVLS
ncbi:hypothetical protein IFT48_02110 [Pseudomonas fluorescens]|uniref:hypothetical protein n=1 Tax=Pseudomonas TaxID=286 RepID=UPI00177F117F|nr:MULTISPECIES: hypothetical protein [Pseudomonas]MBD8088757.1 hypothetical protein [Pseudomonas fluorescens]MBD8614782.1 hypothetical protein [Pseudomonas putida]MBD8681534.1 hypothetical protein [Pseudomonas sp. CFBP 13719]